MAGDARAGSLTPDAMVGSTFTVTTLGAYGVDFFTPIINPPNVAILGVGRVRDNAERTMTMSLTFDHRAVDGVPAAQFLASVKDRLEAPLGLLS